MIKRIREVNWDTVLKKFVLKDDRGIKTEVVIPSGPDLSGDGYSDDKYGQIHSTGTHSLVNNATPLLLSGCAPAHSGGLLTVNEDGTFRFAGPGFYAVKAYGSIIGTDGKVEFDLFGNGDYPETAPVRAGGFGTELSVSPVIAVFEDYQSDWDVSFALREATAPASVNSFGISVEVWKLA